jgi:pilus assembly protein FimV
MADLQVTPQRLPDGRFVLRLASERVINEPFVDLLLEANWAAGRLVRDYTLLFDPPGGANAASSAAATGPASAPAAAPSLPPLPAAPAAQEAASAPGSSPAAPTPAVTATPPVRVTVQSGDTAGRIAARNKPPTVSLEQMLVAMLQANPDAFVANNMNRLRAGAVLEVPSDAAAAAVEPQDARRTVIAQSQDFNAYRRRLAEQAAAAPAAPSAEAGRQASGQVQAQVQEKKPAPPARDRLTLSQGAVQGQAAPATPGREEQIARDRATQEANSRLAELDRNLAELNRLGMASGTGGGAASTPAGGAAALPAPPGLAATAASGAASEPATTASAAAASASAAASEPAAEAASAPAEPASAAASAPAGVASGTEGAMAAGSAWPQRLAEFTRPPWSWALAAGAIGGLAAMAAALGWIRRSRKAAQAGAAPAPTEPSVAGRDRGASAATAFAAGRVAQLGTGSARERDGESDPLAEAEVYLAYGRDLQAEEILQQALRQTPERLPVIAKLLEVYARRFDWDAFEPLARQARALTAGQGAEWARIAELGRSLGPVGHPLFSEAGETASAAPPSAPIPEGLALDVENFRMPPLRPPAAVPAAAVDPGGDPDVTDFATDAPAARPAAAARPTQSFDLADLSLNVSEPGDSLPADPLEAKLSLAEEFRSIGDTEGARSLAEEVRAQADGALRQRAERLLSELG